MPAGLRQHDEHHDLSKETSVVLPGGRYLFFALPPFTNAVQNADIST
jgi:hypothetical protein